MVRCIMSVLALHFVSGMFFMTAGKLSSGSGLKWVRINIPQYQIPGETATLECDYDLGNYTLYAVKWYKDHEEFYRFVPKARPQVNWYKIEGVEVDPSKSDSNKVKLHSVSWKTSGLYKCEVSAEAPSFASAEAESNMEIIILPEDDPVITGVETQYQLGDEVNLNCTAGRSRPASILHWYINEQIQKQEALIRYPPEQQPQGLISSTLGLRFKLSEHHFKDGSMKVKCVASIAPILYKGEWESVVQTQRVPMKEMREALLLVKGSANRFSSDILVLLIISYFIT